MRHFVYKTLDELRRAADEAGAAHVRFAAGPEEVRRVLARPVRVGALTVGNSIAIQPMEGCDGTLDGASRRAHLAPLRTLRARRRQADLVRSYRRARGRARQHPPALDHAAQRGGFRAARRAHPRSASRTLGQRGRPAGAHPAYAFRALQRAAPHHRVSQSAHRPEDRHAAGLSRRSPTTNWSAWKTIT